jgi:3-oxoacyl-[acyl-carrier protein] reductase
MDLALHGRVALVTGASRGIGAAIARGVALCARGEEALQRTASEIEGSGAEVLALQSDLLVAGEPERVTKATIERFGRIDILVNNLGGGRSADTEEAWSFTYEINLGVATRTCRAAIPTMMAQRRGAIIIVSSISGWQSGGSAAYGAMKAAEIHYARSLARELGPHGIRANAVSPGSILFPGGGWEKKQGEQPEAIAAFVEEAMPLGRFGTPQDVADVVVFLSSDRASFVTGANVAVDGCQLRPTV